MPATGPKPRIGLAAAVLLLVALSVITHLSSSPTRSPSKTLATWAWELRYELYPLDDETALETLHLNAQEGSREQCVACHGDKTASQLPVHRIHLRSALLPNLACQDCHPQVDLGPRTATTIAKWVDVGFCKTCHSAFPGLEPDSHMHAEDIDADCTMCHTGARAIRHAKPYLSQIIPPSECRGCHGGRVLPWTPRHERDDWLEHHGMEALETGPDNCLACHDFGLKFCDECHAETPPSHLPAELWRDSHPEAAATDTRVCYTCHQTSMCKQCHVNHEAGWLQAHPDFVRERGDESCTECHSLSSCSFCHTAEAVAAGSVAPTNTP